MGRLKDFFERAESNSSACSAVKANVVSLLDRKNQRTEQQLADCMREIQKLMVSKREKAPENKLFNKVNVISSIRSPEITFS